MNPTICNMTLEERLRWELEEEKEVHEIEKELLIHHIEVLKEKLASK